MTTTIFLVSTILGFALPRFDVVRCLLLTGSVAGRGSACPQSIWEPSLVYQTATVWVVFVVGALGVGALGVTLVLRGYIDYIRREA